MNNIPCNPAMLYWNTAFTNAKSYTKCTIRYGNFKLAICLHALRHAGQLFKKYNDQLVSLTFNSQDHFDPFRLLDTTA